MVDLSISHAPCYNCGCVIWYTSYMRDIYSGEMISCTFCEDCHQGYTTDKWMVWQTAILVERERDLNLRLKSVKLPL